jgi:hypothetical protein
MLARELMVLGNDVEIDPIDQFLHILRDPFEWDPESAKELLKPLPLHPEQRHLL